MSNIAINLFVSYSHDDEPYFKVFSEGLMKVAKNAEHFKWNIWDDTKIHIGTFWDDEIQNNIKGCNVALLLVSVGFMSSNYIKEKEFAEFKKRYADKGILIVPIVFKPCDFNRWEDLGKLQFFKPKGSDYGKNDIPNFTYADLIKFRETDGTLIPNPNIDRYHLDLVRKIEESYQDFLSRSKTPVLSELPNVNENKLSNAPIPRPYFTGRDKEIEEFKNAIDSGNRFIAIDGPGGIGKTQFVSYCIQQYIPANKIIWFKCTSASQLDTLISEAGYPELLKGTSKTDLEKFSAFKDKIQENEFFLFLDDFQETNSNPVFKEFLKFIQDYLKKGCVIVIDRDDIRSIKLAPKPIHIEGLKEKKLEYAKALITHSYTNEVNISDTELENLCTQLQGYPLAIDFAILLLSQGETTSNIITKIVNENEDDVKEISERLLNAIFTRPDASQEEKDFIKQFSVFTSNVNAEALKAVIDESLVNVALKRLQKKNLLSFSDGNYEIHPLVREFCYKELQNKKEVHAKAAEYYITQRSVILNPALEEQVFYHLAKSEQWERIEKEITDNGRQFILLGQLGLVKELLNKLKNMAIEKPIFNILFGDIAEIQGKWDDAQEYYYRARQQTEDKKIKAEGIIKYGEILYRKGQVNDALPYFEEAYQFSNQNNLLNEKARAVNDIGLVYKIFDDLNTAYIKVSEGLIIRETTNDKQGIAASLCNIGEIFNAKNLLDNALEYQERSLSIYEKIGDKYGMGTILNNIGKVYKAKGKFKEALEFYQRSLNLFEEIGNKQGISVSLGNHGELFSIQSFLEKALNYFEQSLEINEEIGYKEGIAIAHFNIATVYCKAKKKQYELALIFFLRSLSIFNKMGVRNSSADCIKWINGLRDKAVGLQKFKIIAKKAYDELEPEMQQYIPINVILKENIKFNPPTSRNAPCPCGSGKQYKRCHGK